MKWNQKKIIICDFVWGRAGGGGVMNHAEKKSTY